MTITVGTRITAGIEEFAVVKSLNSGGCGETFLAVRKKPDPNIEVAIKVPYPHVLIDPVWSKKFAREARILGNLSHPNVVKCIAFWEFPSGDKALVQELVVGANELPEYLAAHPNEVASVFLQALYGLRAAHEEATPAAVHRDLSPRNILVNDKGVVKIIDFGLAKEHPRATAVLTVTGATFGTPGCMSPEQLENAATVDHRTDLFALGRTFTAAIQSRHPAAGRTEKLPEPWKTICTRLCEDDPADRYQSAREALTDAMLRFAAAGTPIEHFGFHTREMGRDPVDGWPQLVESYFRIMADFDQDTVELIHKLKPAVFAPPFDADGLFDKLDASSAVTDVRKSSFIVFDHADPVGAVLARLYEHLDLPRKLTCFKRLCRIAVRRHRYPVMESARHAYKAETDPVVRSQLDAILEAADPDHIIQGRGVLPRTP